MPSSDPRCIPAVIRIVKRLAPHSVLDLGAGMGKYGVLFREYLTLRHFGKMGEYPDEHALQEKIRIDAVEGFADYVTELHRCVYDNVYVSRIQDHAIAPDSYDVIYMGDVLEHIDKKEATEIGLLDRLVGGATMGVIISVPATVKEQDDVFGNELEIHRSQWSPADFRAAAPYAHIGRAGYSRIAFLTRDKKAYDRLKRNPVRRKLHNLRYALSDYWE